MKTLIEEYEDEDIYESSSEENDQEANLVYLNNDLGEKEDEEENERNIKLKKSNISFKKILFYFNKKIVQNRKKMMKKYQSNILKEYRKLILRFFIFVILIQIYSLINIIGMINIGQSLEFLFPQLFQYGYYPTMYSYTYNLHRTMLMQPEYPIQNKTAIDAAHSSLLPFYNIDREINDVEYIYYIF